ncbi:hypothetical protein, partial [Legionella pneumophila]|uniref:hypothetical protein n=1 Tax=Legionella pneumophila TaxID=446 RepID=UPI001B7D8E27
ESFLTPLIESFPPPEFILLKKTIVGGSIFSRQRGSVYIQQRHYYLFIAKWYIVSNHGMTHYSKNKSSCCVQLVNSNHGNLGR